MNNVLVKIPCCSLNLPLDAVNELVQHYNAQGRFYHNWDHITNMFYTAHQHGLFLTESQEFAILYHDVVYNVGDTQNEEYSCDFFENHVERFFPTLDRDFIDDVINIIMATSCHTVDQPNISYDAKMVLDLDLYGFCDTELYRDSIIKLFNEAFHSESYDKQSYLINRKKFLTKMLDRGCIYYLPQFSHISAINNIKLELAAMDMYYEFNIE